jgi:ribosomal-protein-alanine N-acetyltransferase
VRAGNEAAKQLYREYGFVEVNRRVRYYADNNEDALIMTVFLSDGRD